MDEETRRGLTELLLEATPQQLREIHAACAETLRDLQDLNTAFPATQEFLRERGLTHVRELDAQGLEDLKSHLQKIHDRLYKNKA